VCVPKSIKRSCSRLNGNSRTLFNQPTSPNHQQSTRN